VPSALPSSRKSAFHRQTDDSSPHRRVLELSLAEARELAAASLVFSTHTPVKAGHDYFHADLINRYFSETARQLGLSKADFLELGSADGTGEFCMTVLASRLASCVNGVSKLHGEVSRKMWQSLCPSVPVGEVPISRAKPTRKMTPVKSPREFRSPDSSRSTNCLSLDDTPHGLRRIFGRSLLRHYPLNDERKGQASYPFEFRFGFLFQDCAGNREFN
jgi:hypothetical protein